MHTNGGFISAEQKDMLCPHFEELDDINVRARKETMMRKISTKTLERVQVQRVKQLMSGGLQTFLMMRRDHFRGLTKISGLSCKLDVKLENGAVVGYCSVSMSAKPFEVYYRTLEPKATDINPELKRLYFT